MITRRHFLKIGGLTVTASGWVTSLFSSPAQDQTATLQNMVADVKPLTTKDYAARLEKARRLIAENKMDGLFIEGGTNLVYFTRVNWWRSERTFGAVFSLKRDPVWVCPAFERKRAEELVPSGQEIRTWEEHESPYALIGGIMKDLGAGGGRLGLDPSMRHFIYHGLRKDAASLELVDGAVVTEGCRGVKTEKEIAYMGLANRITKLAYREAFRELREGMSPRDLAAAVSAAHQKMGVNGGGGPQFGPNSAFPHGSQVVRNLQKGDAVLVDGGCAVEGYRSDITRTIFFGRPTDRQRRVWEIVRKAQAAALKTVKPGVPCEAVDAAARKVIEDAGFGPDYKYFTHRLGHGIGLEGHEYPYFVRGNTLKLEPGMTLSNEPGIYIYGEFGVRIEDCLVVTEDGGRTLGGLESTAPEKPFGE
ncbi:MAG: Xaa-Pro peptidase family protein [Candidatus Aminicenantales bacterium]